jgi:hypothetical protein
MMDELDTITDLGAQLHDRRTSERPIDPIQRVLSKASMGLSSKSTRLRNRLTDSITEEIPRMIDQKSEERRLSQVLTCIMTRPRRMSAASEDGQELGGVPSREIQPWLVATEPQSIPLPPLKQMTRQKTEPRAITRPPSR